MKNSFYIKQTNSTNALLWRMIREESLPEGFVVQTDFQTGGKGQIGNSWESEAGKNLLFSMVLYPYHIVPDQQFLLSQIVSLGIKKALDEYTEDITVKWPNDIYWNDKKLVGILIENSLQGNRIKSVVIGIGLNVNQLSFVSDAPNPVSLQQITGRRINRKLLLARICRNILELYGGLDIKKIRAAYAGSLYRKEGFYAYSTETETFQAKIIQVHLDGQLELETEAGERKGFYFKEVKFQ
ncbi:MAG TPA: biotin--[acetyl-CoA-carboxylase] ligase [Paludibacter sp.]|nr:biotin--[acetyl-CoA-carboxylase] ligase [Paludibacter sp.]